MIEVKLVASSYVWKCCREINPLSWTMDTNKNFNSCCGGWERGRRKETLALHYSWYSSYLTAASPCYSFTEGFLIHPFFEGWMRLGWVFWYFPHTNAAGSFYRKQLGLTSLALRIWNPQGLQILTCCSHHRYWIEALLSSLRTCQNLAKPVGDCGLPLYLMLLGSVEFSCFISQWVLIQKPTFIWPRFIQGLS